MRLLGRPESGISRKDFHDCISLSFFASEQRKHNDSAIWSGGLRSGDEPCSWIPCHQLFSFSAVQTLLFGPVLEILEPCFFLLCAQCMFVGVYLYTTNGCVTIRLLNQLAGRFCSTGWLEISPCCTLGFVLCIVRSS